MTEREWTLFLDETGSFKDPNDHHAVAGVLASEPAAQLGPRLRRSLCDAAPGWPWPIHATFTRLPSMHALCAHLEPEPGEHIDRAISVWKQEAPSLLERVLVALREGGEPRYEDARTLSTVLQQSDPHTYDWLRCRTDGVRSQLVRVVEALASEVPADEELLVVTAAEGVQGTAAEGVQAPADLYLELLAVAIERVAHALLLRGGHHKVNVWPLTRHVRDRIGGRTKCRPLHTSHVAAAATDATGSAARRAEWRGSSCRMNPFRPTEFSPEAHAFHVLADLAANVSYSHVSRWIPLATLLESLEQQIGLPLRARAPETPPAGDPASGLPMTAATGPPRDEVRLAYTQADDHRAGDQSHAPHTPTEPIPGLRPWAREQADLWVQAFTLDEGDSQ